MKKIEKYEPQIGEILEVNGVQIQCVESFPEGWACECRNCFFGNIIKTNMYEESYCSGEHIVKCCPDEREGSENVIFKPVIQNEYQNS